MKTVTIPLVPHQVNALVPKSALFVDVERDVENYPHDSLFEEQMIVCLRTRVMQTSYKETKKQISIPEFKTETFALPATFWDYIKKSLNVPLEKLSVWLWRCRHSGWLFSCNHFTQLERFIYNCRIKYNVNYYTHTKKSGTKTIDVITQENIKICPHHYGSPSDRSSCMTFLVYHDKRDELLSNFIASTNYLDKLIRILEQDKRIYKFLEINGSAEFIMYVNYLKDAARYLRN